MAHERSAGLIGRRSELAVFGATLAELAAGRGGSILVAGEPGIGKSALLDAGVAVARARGFRVVRGACEKFELQSPLAAMVRTLGAEAGSVDAPAGDPAAGERLLGEVDRWCAAGPLVFAMDDLQWADESSLWLWRRMIRTAAQLPLLVVGAARQVPARDALEGLRRDLRARGERIVELPPLTDAEVAALVRRWAGRRPGPRLAAQLGSVAGNPLYLRELLDALRRADALVIADGFVDLRGVERPAPRDADAASLAGAITDRLDFVSEQCLVVLRGAALLGADFSARELAEIVGGGPVVLLEQLEEAIAARVLESVGSRLRFRHGLIRQALFEATPPDRRAVLLRQAARSLIGAGAAAERVAKLLLAAETPAPEWELDWVAQNAEQLTGRAPALAADLLEHALQQMEGTDSAAGIESHGAVLRDHLAMAALQTWRAGLAERTTRGILAEAVDGDRLGQAAWILGYVLWRSERTEEALAVAAEALADPRTTLVWHARLSPLHAIIRHSAGHIAQAREELARAVERAERLSDPMASGYALHWASFERMLAGDDQEALRRIERGLAAIGEDPRFTDLRLLMSGNLGSILMAQDRDREGAEVLSEAGKRAERIGCTSRLACLQLHAAVHAFSRGRWDEAAAEFEALIDLGFTEQPKQNLAVVHGLSALIALRRDDPRKAARHIAEFDDEVAVLSTTGWGSAPYRLAAALAQERAGRLDSAVDTLTAVLDTEPGQVANRELCYTTLVRLAVKVGNPDLASRFERASSADALAMPGYEKSAIAQWCAGLAQSEPAPVLEAADYFRSTSRLPDLGYALEDAAVLLARAGRRGQAREALTEAMSVYSRLSAAWDSRRAAARLRAVGLPVGARGPRGRPRTGWDSLTETERRVAELVGQGGSNSDIAERMALSRRTVEVHVSHILSKLELRSRKEVAGSADRPPPSS